MSTPELTRPLETVEEVADVIRSGIEEAKSLLARSIVRGAEEDKRAMSPRVMEGNRDLLRFSSSITTMVCGMIENVPQGYDQGITLRRKDLNALENIQIEDMSSQEAIAAALTQICGEPQEATQETVDRNSYVVNLEFAITGLGKDKLPTLMLGKIEKREDGLKTMARVHEKLLEDHAYLTGLGANIHSSSGTIEGRREHLVEKENKIREGLTKVKEAQNDGTKAPFVVWLGGLTDMSLTSQIHTLYGLGGNVHMIEVPRTEAGVETELHSLRADLEATGSI